MMRAPAVRCNKRWAKVSRVAADAFEEAPAAYDGSAGLSKWALVAATDKTSWPRRCQSAGFDLSSLFGSDNDWWPWMSVPTRSREL